jgi:hypothetical protein
VIFLRFSQYKEVVNKNNKNISLINLDEIKINSAVKILGVYQKIIEKKEKRKGKNNITN